MAKKRTPLKKPHLTPKEMIFLMGPVRFCPQYWAASTTMPMPIPAAICWRVNWS